MHRVKLQVPHNYLSFVSVCISITTWWNFIPVKSVSNQEYVLGNRQQPVSHFPVGSLLYSYSVVLRATRQTVQYSGRKPLRSQGTRYQHIPHQTNEEKVNTQLVWQEFTSLWNYFVIDKLIKPSRKRPSLHLTIVPWGDHIAPEQRMFCISPPAQQCFCQ